MAVNVDNLRDSSVDDEIFACLNPQQPRSFFLFAGAGSGKTRSLVTALKRVRQEYGNHFRVKKNKIAVITYTNAACDEIKNRISHDSLFTVCTIHSFVWEMIKPYTNDIREWVRGNISREIMELQEQQGKGRGGKAAIERERKIESKTRRLENLDKIKRFTYNPNGDNSTKDSLNHAEVIAMGAFFFSHKPLMQDILTRTYPVLLVDESQDTKKELIEAFFEVQTKKKNQFALGLFGDTMQRIYSDGKEDLGSSLPEDWARPVKKINHRCPKRVITLINKIRSKADAQEQEPRKDKEEGLVRFFVVTNKEGLEKSKIEEYVSQRMAELTNDPLWYGRDAAIKILALEHHMAASRLGFLQLFQPLYKIDRIKTSLLDGSLPGIRFFTEYVLPLVQHKMIGDEFGVTRIVRTYSPWFKKDSFEEQDEPMQIIKKVREAVDSLFALWNDNVDPSLLDVLKNVAQSRLFSIPESLQPIVAVDLPVEIAEKQEEDNTKGDELSDAWRNALASPFSQVMAYENYISNKARIGTHQGVKGLEFDRVMAILDDSEARGFLFSYEKLFSAKEESDVDKKNRQQGKETSIDRTRRLFYVICSRAQRSLAIVAYTEDPESVKRYVLEEGWFGAEEIEVVE